MPSLSQQKQQQDLVSRLEQLKSLFSQIQQEIEQLSSIGELAPKGAWIIRYQARGRGGTSLVLQVAISRGYLCDQRWEKVLP
jgi:hypothetical protein